jgi:translation initiation factor 2 beta subunit (eIF-2beta)/eIF-5
MTRQDTVERLLETIKADFPEAPEGMSKDDFDRLCSNIARAIAAGLQMHEDRHHQIKPEFGEPDRPSD